MCNYLDAYIVMKETTTLESTNANNRTNKELAFMNNASFRSYIIKITTTFIDNAEDLDIVMSMYNLSDHTDNYSMTSGSKWN